jgi:hypothetical protein
MFDDIRRASFAKRVSTIVVEEFRLPLPEDETYRSIRETCADAVDMVRRDGRYNEYDAAVLYILSFCNVLCERVEHSEDDIEAAELALMLDLQQKTFVLLKRAKCGPATQVHVLVQRWRTIQERSGRLLEKRLGGHEQAVAALSAAFTDKLAMRKPSSVG